jgi:hypothetical protein
MPNWVYNCVADSIQNNELINVMTGSGRYFLPMREFPDCHDCGAILYAGIHEVYNQDKAIKKHFENALSQLINGTIEELMIAFDYIWMHKGREFRNTAPFRLDEKIIDILEKKIRDNKFQLKSYKEHYQWGSELPEGAWEYVHNFLKIDL